MKIHCDFSLCIYNECDECLLDTVSVDMQGVCTDCEMVSLDADMVEKQKNIQRYKYEL